MSGWGLYYVLWSKLPQRVYFPTITSFLDGEVDWAEQWSQAEIEAGRGSERQRFEVYY